MEYQSFFMLLKKYQIENSKFLSVNPLSADGFVQIKKEKDKTFATIQLNSFVDKTRCFFVQDNIVKQIDITAATTKTQLEMLVDINKLCVIVFDYNLFAVKNSTENCYKSIMLINEYLQNLKKNNCSILEKVFNAPVYDTYFFDCIKSKLASLFALGQPCYELSNKFECSKWIEVLIKQTKKVIGVIYKDDFAYAVGIGEQVSAEKEFCSGQVYKLQNNVYNILFLSASNGKVINV